MAITYTHKSFHLSPEFIAKFDEYHELPEDRNLRRKHVKTLTGEMTAGRFIFFTSAVISCCISDPRLPTTA